MSVVTDFSLVVVATVVGGSAWYGFAPYVTGARAARAGRHVEREGGAVLRDHGATSA